MYPYKKQSILNLKAVYYKLVIFILSTFIIIGSSSLTAASASASYSGHGYTAVIITRGRPQVRTVDAIGANILAHKGYNVAKTKIYTLTDNEISPPSENVTPTIPDVAPSGTLVAVVDTGIDDTHPWLANRVVLGHSFVEYTDPETEWRDEYGHGTHIAGIIRQGYPAVQLMSVRVINAFGSGTDDAIAAGILWAVDNNAKVINLSLGSTQDSYAISSAITYAKDHDIVIVAAAGNSAEDGSPIMYPASDINVLAVAAVDENHEVTYFSNRGTYVDVAALGWQVISAKMGGGFISESGTSMAAPKVAALAANLRALHGTWSEATVRAHIEATSTDLAPPGPDSSYGFGEINFVTALSTTDPVSVFGMVPAPDELSLSVVPFIGGVTVTPSVDVLNMQITEASTGIPLYSLSYPLGSNGDYRVSLAAATEVLVFGSDPSGTPYTPVRLILNPLQARPLRITGTLSGSTVKILATAYPTKDIKRMVVYIIYASGHSKALSSQKLQSVGKTTIIIKTVKDQYKSTGYQACLIDFSGLPFNCTKIIHTR
jgi:subtilisin family serine protease